jgi:hypothetical protein
MSSLFFYRKGFIGGSLHIEDRVFDEEQGDYIIVKKRVRAEHNYTRVQISDPEFVMEKYPQWFYRRKPKRD